MLLAACGGDAEPAQPADTSANIAPTEAVTAPETTDNQQPVTDQNNDGLVARVNGEGITREALDAAIARRSLAIPGEDQATVTRQVLESLIEQTLIEQAAPQLGVTVTDDEVAQELQNLKDAVTSQTEWDTFLELNGYTEETMLAAQRESLITQRVRDQLSQSLTGNVLQVHARHILVRTEDEAVTALNRLQAGESFDVVAADSSIDMTTREQGGDLGWFTRDELMDARLADVAFDLEPEQIAGPIPTSLGYHIIQTIEIGERPVDESRLPVLMENVFSSWLAEQYQQATIERYIQ